VDSCPPSDAGEVVDSICESQILVSTVTLAVVVAGLMSVTILLTISREYILEELAVPIVNPLQHRGNVMASHQD
jgi:ABC-type protease/lipase transport system fused ATPase/permease subunit